MGKKEIKGVHVIPRQPVTFVFNSRMLIPWDKVSRVDGIRRVPLSEEDVVDAIVIWQEAHMVGHKYSQNDRVADVMNPSQEMAVRRIVFDGKENGKILGVECYWWMDLTLEELERQRKTYSERKSFRTVNKDIKP